MTFEDLTCNPGHAPHESTSVRSMTTAEKLKLFRALYFLKQEEMVDLAVKAARRFYKDQGVTDEKEVANCANFSHTFYRGIESGRKKLPARKAKSLARPLLLNDAWLLGNEAKPLAGAGMLFIEYPPQRLLYLTQKDRDRQLRESCEAVASLLPQFLGENRLSHLWWGRVSDKCSLALFNFSDDQFLLFCIDVDMFVKWPKDESYFGFNGGKYEIDFFMATFNDMFVDKFRELSPVVKDIDRVLFDKIARWSSVDLLRFMDLMGVGKVFQEKLKMGMKTLHGTISDLYRHLDTPEYDKMLDRITSFIALHDIHLDEIIRILRKYEREDLVPTGVEF